MLTPVGGGKGASTFLSGIRMSDLTRKLARVTTGLLPELRGADSIQQKARLVLSFLPELFSSRIASSLIVVTGEQAGVLAGSGEGPLVLDDLRVATPESPAGHVLAHKKALYLPDLETRNAVYMPLGEVQKLAQGKAPDIRQGGIYALIPTLEEGSVDGLKEHGFRSALFVSLATVSGQKVLLVVGFSEVGRPEHSVETVMLGAALATVFS